jgi:hypothetical protein
MNNPSQWPSLVGHRAIGGRLVGIHDLNLWEYRLWF